MKPSTFRGRRLRRTPALRGLVRETRLHPEMLVAPLFVRPGTRIREEIGSMPGQDRLSVDELSRQAEPLLEAGVRSVLLFGLPEDKDDEGSGAWADDGIVQTAIRELRRAGGKELAIIADVCLCEYTDHGHCGVLRGASVDNDATLSLLARTAASLADAGADVVAPSAMMDGQVAAIREALPDTAILAYAAKHASAFYGPFREAADSAPAFGDRRSYQMDPANGREALAEILADVEQGADVIMVKPALPALDLVAAARAHTNLPVAAYQVSGEYAAICAAAERGWLDRRAAALESLTAMSRAGAGILVTYFALEAARWLREMDR
ncbi:MAG: porphobilinogen synthase [Chloroflexi bacterium]|nr:porphobilinogen synthase [Chloroflexota bacterium]MBA3740790.1 porphobilinogen synthase [Chloroflexota bacterium]